MTYYDVPPPVDTPLYFVVAERDQSLENMPLGAYRILKVFKCTASQVDVIYSTFVAPLYNSGRSIQTFTFFREPANPFADATGDQLGEIEPAPADDRAAKAGIDYKSPEAWRT
jgi:hypothetical protein